MSIAIINLGGEGSCDSALTLTIAGECKEYAIETDAWNLISDYVQRHNKTAWFPFVIDIKEDFEYCQKIFNTMDSDLILK